MRRALLLLALAVPALGRAQTQTAGTITFVPNAYIGARECDPTRGETIDTRWAVSGSSVGAGTYRIYASSRAPAAGTNGVTLCDTGDVPADGVWAAQVGRDITASGSGTQNEDLIASEFVQATAPPATGETDPCAASVTRTIYVCVHFFPLNQSTATASATGQLQLDLKAPPPPVNVAVSPGENGLRVSWDEGSGGQADTTYYRIQARTTDPRDPRQTHDQGDFTGESGRIDGLVNGVTYEVTVTAFSAADNPSEPSPAVLGTPVPVSDFWEHYEESGGQEQGGCASGPAGALGILGAALALALHRRRK